MKFIGHFVKRPERYENDFQTFANKQSEKYIPESPFESMKDMCMYAALLGINYESYIPFSKGEGIKINIFTENDVEIIKMIALAHTGSILVLNDESKIIKIFEGYINGGMTYLLDIFKSVSYELLTEKMIEFVLNKLNKR